MELILTAVAVVLAEACILAVFEHRAEKRWVKQVRVKEEPETSDERFWQNIISYDHKKGGEKE